MEEATAYFWLATTETVMMAVVVFWGVRRWSILDRGGRFHIVSIAVYLAYAMVAAPLSLRGVRTRLLQEGPQLVATILALLGFAAWQPKRWQRQVVLVAIGAYVVTWGVAQYLQGVAADFSLVSGPAQILFVTAASGFTLVTRVQVTYERWTSEFWFWLCTGMMVIYGATVVFEPLLANLFGDRNDLVNLAYHARLVLAIAGYLMIAWGVWQVDRPVATGRRGARRSVVPGG
ncbi:MAG: hypothetical protein KF785_11220 [Gemmatimonadales bacterium]|nr:hypothetical protein [Gemmatimonadales bacterium]